MRSEMISRIGAGRLGTLGLVLVLSVACEDSPDRSGAASGAASSLPATPRADVTAPMPSPVTPRVFTVSELANHRGIDGSPVYLAVRGKIYDVNSSARLYGPGGPYHLFAGRDVSRSLALSSFDEATAARGGDLSGLNARQLAELDAWEKKLEAKYEVVGILDSAGAVDSASRPSVQGDGATP